MAALRWDVFCRVIDNFGDIGVCWRLARQLAASGDRVRLHVDDDSALAWMAPAGAAGVAVHPWPGGRAAAAPATGPAAPGTADVVIEAFGCELPPGVVHTLAASAAARAAGREPPPVWINLEYLSAEPYVERSHGLPSPQRIGPDKFFFYPGFGERTGGLLREPGLQQASAGTGPAAGERLVSLFAYANPRLEPLLQALAGPPTRLLVPPGPIADALAARTGPWPPGLRVRFLPFTDQDGFDRLLRACDFNFVRGEDSLVRAIWAGAPFVWMPYPQHDGAHRAKLEAMIDRMALPEDTAALWLAWSGFAPWPARWPDVAKWAAAVARFRAGLLAQDDLVTRLRRFVGARRAPGPG